MVLPGEFASHSTGVLRVRDFALRDTPRLVTEGRFEATNLY
jgi:hypothetical protein